MLKLFDLTLQLNGFPLQEAKTELQKIIALTESEYAAHLDKKKKEIVAFHLKNNAFYASLVGANFSENWDDLPILTKKNLQKPLAERLSKGYSEKSVFVNKTSGSSGDPFIFAKDKAAHAITWASIIYRFGWFGVDFNTSFQARFYGIPLDFIGNKKERIKDFLSRRYRFTIFDLSDDVLEKVLFKFKQKKFDYITRRPAKYPKIQDENTFRALRGAEQRNSAHAWHYIPKSKVAAAEKKIQEGDIVLLASSKPGLDIAHEGFAVKIRGRIHLLHASSIGKKVLVSAEPLASYLVKQKGMLGVMVARLL